MMKPFAVAVAASVSSGVVFAADLPQRTEPPPPPPSVIYDAPSSYAWNGFYLGDHVGYGWTSSTTSLYDAATGLNPDRRGLDSRGVLSGVQAGYNLRLSTMVVAGVEVDASLAGMTGNRYKNNSTNTEIESLEQTRTNAIGTARLRLGYVMNNVMFYATGGLAVRNLTNWRTQYATIQPAATAPPFVAGPVSTSKWWSAPIGWTVGAGVEWAFAKQWTLKGEALYMGWASDTSIDSHVLPSVYGYFPATATKSVIRRTTSGTFIAQLGVNYQFGWGDAPAAIAAKY